MAPGRQPAAPLTLHHLGVGVSADGEQRHGQGGQHQAAARHGGGAGRGACGCGGARAVARGEGARCAREAPVARGTAVTARLDLSARVLGGPGRGPRRTARHGPSAALPRALCPGRSPTVWTYGAFERRVRSQAASVRLAAAIGCYNRALVAALRLNDTPVACMSGSYEPPVAAARQSGLGCEEAAVEEAAEALQRGQNAAAAPGKASPSSPPRPKPGRSRCGYSAQGAAAAQGRSLASPTGAGGIALTGHESEDWGSHT